MAKLIDETTKKPHPFSKEWRELREAQLQQPQVTVPEATTKTEQPDLSAILARLDKAEARTKELEDSMKHPSTLGHEVNKDPKCFSYKMRGGKPVLSWITKKKDPTKDLVYRVPWTSIFESNHYLELVLLWEENTIEVEVNEFGVHHTKSDKMIALDQHGEEISNESLPLARTFTFDTPEFGKFTVALAYIN